MKRKCYTKALCAILLFMAFNLQAQELTNNDSDMCAQKTMRLIHDASNLQHEVYENMYLPYTKIKVIKLNPQIKDVTNYNVGDKLIIELFDKDSYLSTIDRVNIDVNGTLTIRARIDDYPMGYLLLSVSGDNYLGSIVIPEKSKRYRIKTIAKSGKTYLKLVNVAEIEEIETSPPMIPPDKPEIDEEQLQRIKDAASKNSTEEAYIDIMIVYTAQATNWAFNYEGSINNSIALAIELGQLALDNSNTGITLNLVHSALVVYQEEGNDSGTHLRRLTTSDDFSPFGDQYQGYMNEVHEWRDTYGADLVSLLANVTDLGGTAWTLRYQSGYPQSGFSLTSVRAASALTFIHELGHNMGAHHHKEQNTAPGPTEWRDWPENIWSAGWRWQGDDEEYYCDLMTYGWGLYWNDGITSTRLPYFSNPDITYQGQPAGDAADGDNARTLREVKHTIAAYRPETTPTLFNLTLIVEPEGAAMLIEGIGEHAEGSIVNISLIQKKHGYSFHNWTDENHIVISEQASFSIEMPSSDVVYFANFKSHRHNITFNVKDQDGESVENAIITISKDSDISNNGILTHLDKQQNIEKLKLEQSTHIKNLTEPSISNNQEKIMPETFADKTFHGQWIHWDSGINSGFFGYNSPMNFDIASRWFPSDLTPYHGEAISEIRFFPGYTDAVYTVKIWAGEEAQIVYSQVTESPCINSWNIFELDSPFIIDASEVLWFGLNINTQGGWPAGIDNGPVVPGKGDLVNLGGYWGWFSAYDQWGRERNWNIHAFVGDFVLYANEEGQANFESIQGKYTYKAGKDGYHDTSGHATITDTCLIIEVVLEQAATGFWDVSKNQISIFPNPTDDLITIKSDVFIEKVYIVERIGRSIISERIRNYEAVISLSHIGSGLYIIQVYTNKGVLSKKLIVQ